MYAIRSYYAARRGGGANEGFALLEEERERREQRLGVGGFEGGEHRREAGVLALGEREQHREAAAAANLAGFRPLGLGIAKQGERAVARVGENAFSYNFV